MFDKDVTITTSNGRFTYSKEKKGTPMSPCKGKRKKGKKK